MTFIAHQKTGLYLTPVEGKGMGLFCKQDIRSGEIIEACPTLAFNEAAAQSIDQTNLYNYYFSLYFLTDRQANEMGIADKDKAGCLALGMLSMANHNDNPNSYVEKEIHGSRVVTVLKATQDIPANQEITISYGCVWFDPAP